MEGILEMWTGYFAFGSWTKRYFKLEENILNICDKNTKEIYTRVHIRVATIKPQKSKDRAFTIYTGMTKYNLRAENHELKGKWLDAL